MNKCGGCGKFLSGGVACQKCRNMYHRPCVNLTTNQTPKHWICPYCVANTPRKDNTDTPVKGSEEQELEGSPQKLDGSNEILVEIRALRNDTNNFRKEFCHFREEVRAEMKDLRNMYQVCNSRMDEFAGNLESAELRLKKLEESYTEMQELKTQIYTLKQDINNKEQMSLQNDIEISGVTEHKGENVTHIVGLLMTKIGVNLDERDVVQVHRVGPVRIDQDGKQRPRPIVVRVTRQTVHEQVMKSARTRRTITTKDIELTGTLRSVYINERLTKENRLLFGKARALSKQHKWRYTWTREGKVFVREADGKQAFRVRGDNIEAIFNVRHGSVN